LTRIAVICPVWGRDVQLALWLHHMAHHLDYAATLDLSVVPVVCVTTHAEAVTLPPWCEHVIVPNDPLGAKFNAGFQQGGALDARYATVLGPDEFFRPALWDTVAEEAAAGTPFFGFLDAFVYDTEHGKGVYWPGYSNSRRGETVGIGRFTHADLLAAAWWQPYDEERSKSLDASMMRRIGAPAKALIGGERVMLTSLKDSTAKTPFRGFEGATPVPKKTFSQLFNQFTG
jgi:hypothetical protein